MSTTELKKRYTQLVVQNAKARMKPLEPEFSGLTDFSKIDAKEIVREICAELGIE